MDYKKALETDVSGKTEKKTQQIFQSSDRADHRPRRVRARGFWCPRFLSLRLLSRGRQG